MLELLRQGVDHDPSRLLGSEPPAVRVVVTEQVLETRAGHGYLEGTNFPVSLETVERLACAHGTQDVIFDQELRPLDVGRAKRQYTRKQRTRDGGARRRVPDVRATSFLDGGAPHQALGARSRPDEHR